MVKSLYILGEDAFKRIYGPDEQTDIESIVEIVAPPQTADSVRQDPAVLKDVEIIFSGWGAPTMDEGFLAAAQGLRAVFYAAGSVKGFTTDTFWDRGIVLAGGYGANAVAVAEYTLSQILFCLKQGWYYALHAKREGSFPPRIEAAGAYGSVVGIVSLGMAGRRVCELLQRFDVRVIAFDPFADPEDAAALGVELCSLEDLFRRSDAVSLHTPKLEATTGMIRGAHFESMKHGSCLINSSRGAVIREQEMIAVLQRRVDLTVVLDVTDPEPPESGSPLYTLPNVVLTPHLAGCMYRECRRLGRNVYEECRRYLNGEPLRYRITRDMLPRLA